MSFFDKIKRILNENPFSRSFAVNRLRPPGALSEKEFVNLCIRCARCIASCPYDSIKRAPPSEHAQVGTPYVYAEDRGCYLCMLCTSSCPTGAIDKNVTDPLQVKMGKAVIDERRCLDFNYARAEESGENDGTVLYCNICVNSCPLTGKAIILENLLTPKITEFCNGCGVCVERCPTEPKSVSILPTGLAVPPSMENNRKDIIFKADFNTENIVEEWYGSGNK